jgi:peptide/nickel transport system substrate-binding protein
MALGSAVILLSGGLAMAAARPVATTVPPLVLGLEFGSPDFTENFNPFSPTHLDGDNYMYEPLYMVNMLNGKQSPWLATSYRWVSSTDLQFTIRQGVKWSNGTPFTAADVVFTFDLLHRYPALDLNGVWTDLASVTASGNVVTFKFSKPNIPDWYFIATTYIVSKQQWSKVSNPTKFTDPNPIVTGPYVLKSYTPEMYTLAENPLYWQKSQVHVPEIESMALTTNTTADLQLTQGKFDEAALFTPDIQKVYADVNPKSYHYWYPQGVPVNLFMNLTKYPFNQLKFREAVAYAISRPDISAHGEYGYMLPANQSQMPPTMQSKWLDRALQAKYPYTYDPKKAASLLQSMGLKKNKQGQLLGPGGKPLSLTIEVPTGWTDYIQDCEIISNSLGALGIKVQVLTPSVSTWTNDTETGHFDMALNRLTTYPNPYFIYDQLLSSQDSAPVGQVAPSNWERWMNPKTDQLLAEYQRTTNPTQEKAIVDQLQTILYTQLPVVSLVWGTSFNEYQTNHYVGWPTASDGYALPPYYYPDTLSIILHLRPVS